jgi:hypothetical protein
MGWDIFGSFRAPVGRAAAAALLVSLAFAVSAGGGNRPYLPPIPSRPAAAPAKPAAKTATKLPAKPAPAAAPAKSDPAATPAKADPPATPAKQVSMPPIVFFLAKGDANACGTDCTEWIAAEGTIDSGADGRLRALLNKLGKRRLPIYFHSPGGSIPAGLGIGRLLRQHGMTAGVGRTVPAGCDRNVAREPACDKLKRSGRQLIADLDTASVMCNSACVFSLVGAAVRDVDPGAHLGIHSTRISFSLRRIDGSGHVTSMPTHVAPQVESRALKESYDRVAAYMREMGIAPGLLEAARKIPSATVRFLSRDELVAFGIDRRDLIDGLWEFVDQPAGAVAVKVVQWREPATGTFRRMILRVSCSGADTVRFQLARELGAPRIGPPDRFRVKFGASDMQLGPAFMATPMTGWLPLEVRTAYLPVSMLHEANLVIEAMPSSVTSWTPGSAPGSPGKGPSAPGSTAPSPTAPSPSPPAAGQATKVTAQNIGSGLVSLGGRCVVPPATSSPAVAGHI